MRKCIESCINPFAYEVEDGLNLVSKTVMPDDVVSDLCKRDGKGQEAYVGHVEKRVKSEEVCIWASMKRLKLKSWKDCHKSVKGKGIVLKF